MTTKAGVSYLTKHVMCQWLVNNTNRTKYHTFFIVMLLSVCDALIIAASKSRCSQTVCDKARSSMPHTRVALKSHLCNAASKEQQTAA
jgi:hypothetical protein